MADLIDRQALWTDIQMLPHNGDVVSGEEVEQTIADAPAVDAVEVCRCKDCRHGAKDDLDGTYQCVKDAEYDEDTNMYFGFSAWHEADFFCSYGERREDDATEDL